MRKRKPKSSTIEVFEIKIAGRAILFTWDRKPDHTIMRTDILATQQWTHTGYRVRDFQDPKAAAATILGVETKTFTLKPRRDLGAWIRQCENEHRSVLFKSPMQSVRERQAQRREERLSRV